MRVEAFPSNLSTSVLRRDSAARDGLTAVFAPIDGRVRGGDGLPSQPPPVLAILKALLKAALYHCGALSLYHRVRNRNVLTVAMFHRVLKQDDPRWLTALPQWTLSDDHFDACLAFFKRHFTMVTLDDVRASWRRERPLPPRSLLLTFDDGYADNLTEALPLLRAHGAPAVVFVSTDVLGRSERLWTEDVLWAYMAARLDASQLALLYAVVTGGPPPRDAHASTLIWTIVQRGPQCSTREIEPALASLGMNLMRDAHPRQMLAPVEVLELARSGIAIGAHGKTHTALTFASDLASELEAPRTVLNEILAREPGMMVNALSFPHGAFTPDIAARAFASGYELAFATGEALNPLSCGFLQSAVVARVNVDGTHIAAGGRLRPERLAAAFFTRRHAEADWRRLRTTVSR
jgi:peptidoglycan/xylan/chitin deacetylase (PgdA/CDA1 family)